jgi:hypothetical protein
MVTLATRGTPLSALAACLLLGAPVCLSSGCSGPSPLANETKAFFGRLRGGDARSAYDSLASGRREQLSFEQFQAETQRPIFRGHAEISVAATQSHDDTWGCTRGDLVMGGKDWTYDLYMVKESGQWRAHTWAVDEPAPMDRLNKLKQCKQW